MSRKLSSYFSDFLFSFFVTSLFQRRSAQIAFTGQPFAASSTRKNRSFAGWACTVDTRPMTRNTSGTAAAHIPQPMQRLSSTVTVMLPPPRMNIITKTDLFCNSFSPSKPADLLEDPTDFVTLFSFTSSCIYAMLWVLCRPPCPGSPGPVPIGGSYEAPHP